jgi:hypothetical protein
MAMITYQCEGHGFGVVYDDARITHTDHQGDPRFVASWRYRIPTAIAGGVLFLPRGASAESVAFGRVPTLLLTTDDAPQPACDLSRWDWDEAMRVRTAPFRRRTGAEVVEARGMYWRGFPVLQLSAVPEPEDDADGVLCNYVPPTELFAEPIEVLGLMHTPEQTFSSLFVMPVAQVDDWGDEFQKLIDGFFLVPLEREGRARTGMTLVRSLRVYANGLRLTPRA